jgi:hypothetical protein
MLNRVVVLVMLVQNQTQTTKKGGGGGGEWQCIEHRCWSMEQSLQLKFLPKKLHLKAFNNGTHKRADHFSNARAALPSKFVQC